MSYGAQLGNDIECTRIVWLPKILFGGIINQGNLACWVIILSAPAFFFSIEEIGIDDKIGCSLFEVKGNTADSFVVPASSFSLEEIGIDEEIGCSLFEVQGNTADSVVVVSASSFSIEEIVIDEAIGCSLFEVKGNTADSVVVRI